MKKYPFLFSQEEKAFVYEAGSASGMLTRISSIVSGSGYRIFLFIDEYDNYTNTLLSEDKTVNDLYTKLTHDDGILRTFFKVVKSCSASTIARMFITGVSPVSMDDITSGYNIAKDYTTSHLFNNIVGFSENDVREMLQYYSSYYEFNHTVDELIGIMKPWYDNYRFSTRVMKNEPPCNYNSDMVLYFVSTYLEEGCLLPETMVDSNARTDYSKLVHIVQLDKDKSFNKGESLIEKLVAEGETTAVIQKTFPAEKLKEENNLESLLFYYGILTVKGVVPGRTVLGVPNVFIREQIIGYMQMIYGNKGIKWDIEKFDLLLASMAGEGKWRPLFDYTAEVISKSGSSREEQSADETSVKALLKGMIVMNPYFNVYLEQDAGSGNGYIDMFFYKKAPDIVKHTYGVEFKYVHKVEGDAAVARKRDEAIEQIGRYSTSKFASEMTEGTTLHYLVVVYRGFEMAVCEEIFPKQGD